jgi:signal transduction histidine kinase
MRTPPSDFLDNAIRYTPKGGHVALNTWTSGNSCGFTVSDNEIGIAPEDHQGIFERFFRVDTARTSRDGTGLGLAIAKSLMEVIEGLSRSRVTSDKELDSSFDFRALVS